MPDTGAPWNIPYVAGTDLVADWPTDSQTLAEAIADGLDDAGLFGQIVQTVKTDTFTTTSSSYTPVTGLTATITPASNTNQILIIASIPLGVGVGGGDAAHLRLTGGNAANAIGDAASNREQTFMSAGFGADSHPNGFGVLFSTGVYLDSPATTSAVTYGVEVRQVGSTTVYINRSADDADATYRGRNIATLTVLEVKA